MSERVLVTILATAFAIFMGDGMAFAAHPLITDDTGTQGRRKFQVEFIGEYGHDEEDGVTIKSLEIPTPFFSYGVTDTIDIVFGLPYQRVETEEVGITTIVRGISDASVELKWRFYEKDGLSFAVKPGISLPTGDENKGLGNGKVSYSTFFITTKQMKPWAFHLNLGYVHNDYKLQADEDDNRNGIWHASLASEGEVAERLKAVANIGMEKNPDKTSDTHPAFILGGIIYSVTESLDVDLGIKGGINKPETDYSILAGVTMRF